MSDDLTERLREWWDYDHGRLIEQALDRIEELEAKLAWQPIETAPSDYLLFYGNTRHDVGVVFTGWKAQNGLFYEDKGQLVKPTHWMPLPDAPSQN